MPALQTQLNVRSDDFRVNASAMQRLVDDLRTHLTAVAQGGGDAARAKHTARGKLLPRDRGSVLARPRLTIFGAVTIGRSWHVRRRGAQRRINCGDWPHQWRRLHGGVQ